MSLGEQSYLHQTFLIPITLDSDNEDLSSLIDTFIQDGKGIVDYYQLYRVSDFPLNRANEHWIHRTHIIIIRVFTYFRDTIKSFIKGNRVIIRHGCNNGLMGTICCCLPNYKFKVFVEDGSIRTYIGSKLQSSTRSDCISQVYTYKNVEYPIYKAEDKDDCIEEETYQVFQNTKSKYTVENTKEMIAKWQNTIFTHSENNDIINNRLTFYQSLKMPQLSFQGHTFVRRKLVYKYTNKRNKKNKGAIN